MALSANTFRNVLGLVTEYDVIDPSQVPPNSFLDVKNLSLELDGYGISRKGHPVWQEAGSAYKTSPFLSLTVRPQQSTYVNAYYPTDYSTSLWPCQLDNTEDDKTAVKSYIGTPSSGIRAAAVPASSASPQLSPTFAWGPKWVNDSGQLYFNTYDGLYRSVQDSSFKTYTKVRPAYIIAVSGVTASTLTGAATSQNWLLPGYKTTICAIVKEYLTETQFIESRVSSFIDLINFGPKATINIASLTIDTTNLRDLSNCYLEVYRTIQYKPFNNPADGMIAPPTEQRKCIEIPLTKGSTTGTKTTFSNIVLDMNDDFILQQPVLYTDSTAETTINENAIPVTARDMTLFKGYAFYGGVITPPLAKLSLVSLPSSADRLFIGSSESDVLTVSVTDQANASSAPATTGALNFITASFRGTSTSNALVVRPQATTSGVYAVKEYFVTTSTQFTVVGATSAPTRTVRITPASGFDVDPFETPGALAIVEYGATATAGKVVDIMYYRDLENVPGSGFVDFFECSTLSNFTSPPFVASGATYALFFLAGAVVTGDNGFAANFPVYPIDNPLVFPSPITSGAVGWSLLPTYVTYPTSMFIDFPVGRTTTLAYASSAVTATIEWFGIAWKSAAKQLDDCARQLVIDINTAKDTNRAVGTVFATVGPDPAQILLYGDNTIDAAGLSPGLWVRGDNGASGAPTAKYSEDISTTRINITEQTDYPNSLVISKYHRPQAIPAQYHWNPIKIGDENRKILRLGTNSDQLYVFKEEEGIFRVEIIEGGTLPQIASLSQVDSTIWITAPESLQAIQGMLVFLGNKGVFSLINNQLDLISKPIASQIKDEFTKCASDTNLGSTVTERVNKITSFANESRRQYGVYFPTSEKTYVYDFGMNAWSIYSYRLDASVCKSDGRLITASHDGAYYFNPSVTPANLVAGQYYTIRTSTGTDWTLVGSASNTVGTIFKASSSGAGSDFAYSTTWSQLRQDLFTVGYNDTVDQVDDIIPLTGATITTSGNNVTVTRTGATSALANLGVIGARIGGDKLYYKSGSTYYPLTIVSTNTLTGAATFSFDSTKPTVFSADSDSLVKGVNTYAVFNRFYAGGPHTLSRFAEVHPQLPGIHNNMRYVFETNNPALAFAGAVTTIPQSTDVARVLVTCNERRGRWLAVKMIHDYPAQFCKCAGYSVVSRDMDTFRTVFGNS